MKEMNKDKKVKIKHVRELSNALSPQFDLQKQYNLNQNYSKFCVDIGSLFLKI